MMRGAAGAAVILAFAAATAAVAGPPENPDSAIMQDFAARVADYQKLRKDLESGLRRLKSTPSQEEIAHHERELALAIREARRTARPGDMFTPPIAAEFRRLIGIAMQGRNAARVHESLGSAEPVQLRLRVNDAYPAGIPLQSTPPTLLENLPPLPPELEYHLVAHELILLDVKANLVVDMVANVI